MAGYNHANPQRAVYHATYSTPLAPNGDPIKLPENLETLPRAEHFPTQRHRWNTNEEIAAILISFQKHSEWQSREVKVRPRSGSILLYSRKKVRYRRDGYCWKKRKDGKTTREDHMKLKVQGVECIYGCYVHSAILPTFHRRCYWLLQNPDVVLVHYLNVPYPDGDTKLATLPPCLALPSDRKEWTREELTAQLRPMFLSSDDESSSSHLHQSSSHSVDLIVSQLLDRQRALLSTATTTQLAPRRLTPDNQVSSTTGIQQTSSTAPSTPRVYSRNSHSLQNQQSAPLVLSLQQLQGGGGLLILNSQPYHQQQSENQSHPKTQSQTQTKNTAIQSENEQSLVPQGSESNQQIRIENNNEKMIDRLRIHTNAISGNPTNISAFSETLDLSQEDIQRTLSANMTTTSPSPSPIDNHMMNPMDFIDSSDDVLVNLDAFDVFSDLSELHDFGNEKTKNEILNSPTRNEDLPSTDAPVQIAEYSPEWSYTEGGVKVLVAGPWTGGNASQTYSILFDSESVEANLVQPGVLRCRCPAHAPGIASLQVACDGLVVSDSVAFEYRRAPSFDISPEKALLDRLADVGSRLQATESPSTVPHLEERLVTYCQDAVVRTWRAGTEPLQSGPTLLHLAAGLGYTRLACALLYWRSKNSCRILDSEVDVLRRDNSGLTPLAWACAAGHEDTARVLYKWDSMALRMKDHLDRTPTDIAAENGYNSIAEELEHLEIKRQRGEPSSRPASRNTNLSTGDCHSAMELRGEDVRVLPLSGKIIAALPEKMKKTGDSELSTSLGSSPSRFVAPVYGSSHDRQPLNSEDLFDNYRDRSKSAASVSDIDAAASSSSPSSSCLTADSPSPPPSYTDFREFLQSKLNFEDTPDFNECIIHHENQLSLPTSCKAGQINDGAVYNLSKLSLSDREQRDLYQAARMIQKAYRNYKGRQRREEAERHAAVLIQQYYRRHKQYLHHRQATKAALVIQNNYRTYRARPTNNNITPQTSQTVHQAAKKIQQFMRQSKIASSWENPRSTMDRQCRRKRERETAHTPVTNGCCQPKLVLM